MRNVKHAQVSIQLSAHRRESLHIDKPSRLPSDDLQPQRKRATAGVGGGGQLWRREPGSMSKNDFELLVSAPLGAQSVRESRRYSSHREALRHFMQRRR
jgi:hypothetical protein